MSDESGEVELIVLSEHIIDPFDMGYMVGLELSIAACHDDDSIRVLSVYAVDSLSVFVVGGVGDGAGVDDAQVGFLTFACFGVSVFKQLASDG